MIIFGLASKVFGFAAKRAVMVLAPVVAVLAWGAVQDEIDKRKYQDKDNATSS